MHYLNKLINQFGGQKWHCTMEWVTYKLICQPSFDCYSVSCIELHKLSSVKVVKKNYRSKEEN